MILSSDFEGTLLQNPLAEHIQVRKEEKWSYQLTPEYLKERQHPD